MSGAIDKLWRQSLFESVTLSIKAIEGKRVYLDISLEERPRLSTIHYEGVKKNLQTKIKDNLKVNDNEVLNDYKLAQIEKNIKKTLVEKGYLHTEVQLVKKADTMLLNSTVITAKINTGSKVKVGAITFEGNEAKKIEIAGLRSWEKFKRWFKNIGNKEDQAFSDAMLRRTFKDTKQKAWWRFWKRSKYVPSAFKGDLDKTSAAYNKEGFRDFRVVADSVYDISPKLVGIKVKLYEGNRYRFGDISFVGNKKRTVKGSFEYKKGRGLQRRKVQHQLNHESDRDRYKCNVF